MKFRFVDLENAEPGDVVVVVDVLRAFTTVPWAYARGAARVLAVSDVTHAFDLRDRLTTNGDVLVAGEVDGRPPEGFDLGNSPSELEQRDLTGVTLVHRTSAGTQGLARTIGSRLVVAASFVTAGATARLLASSAPSRVDVVVTGASHGRDGDEDRACGELIVARLKGEDPDPGAFLARVATSDAGRVFAAGGPWWAPERDLELACDLDRFDHALVASPVEELDAVEVAPAV